VVGAAPWQRVKYLRVHNRTGAALTVYAEGGDGIVRRWEFATDEVAYLAIDGVRLVASEQLLWAECETRSWDAYRTVPLVLVRVAYQSTNIATYSYAFDP
jgi:hypothetical protein